jgi:hypothetical protein
MSQWHVNLASWGSRVTQRQHRPTANSLDVELADVPALKREHQFKVNAKSLSDHLEQFPRYTFSLMQ